MYYVGHYSVAIKINKNTTLSEQFQNRIEKIVEIIATGMQ